VREKVEVDLQRFATPTASGKDDSLGILLPADIPVRLRCFRLLEDIETNVKGLSGWTTVLDCINFGVKIYVRVGRDGTLRLFAEDEHGREKVREWRK